MRKNKIKIRYNSDLKNQSKMRVELFSQIREDNRVRRGEGVANLEYPLNESKGGR